MKIIPYSYKAKVIKVIDGDTVGLMVDLGFEVYKIVRCRLARINAPEIKETEGINSTTYLKALLPEGKEVTFQSTGYDKYKRSIAEIYVDDINVSDKLVQDCKAVYKNY